MQQYNFRYYSIAYGADFYDKFLNKNTDILKIGNPALQPTFTFCWNYPVILDVERKTVYYHATFGHRNNANEDVFNDNLEEIKNASGLGSRHFLFSDGNLIGTDRFIYLKYWANQPRTTHGRLSDFLYAIVSYVEKDMIKYYIYTIRTDLGAKLLETYFGSYFSTGGEYTEFGVRVVSQLLSKTYINNYVTATDFKDRFREFSRRSLSEYKLKSFFEQYPIRSGS